MTVIWELGLIDYGKAPELQRQFHRQHLLEEIPDVHFSLINPCGFRDRKTTSMESILGENVPLKAVKGRLMIRFSEVFDDQPCPMEEHTHGTWPMMQRRLPQ